MLGVNGRGRLLRWIVEGVDGSSKVDDDEANVPVGVTYGRTGCYWRSVIGGVCVGGACSHVVHC